MKNTRTLRKFALTVPMLLAVSLPAMAAEIHGEYHGIGSTSLGNLTLAKPNYSGVYNTAIGMYALFATIGGSYNTAIGYSALKVNTSGHYNTAGGRHALSQNTTGEKNTATGAQALERNTTGKLNTAMGYEALTFNKTGNLNTALGFRTMRKNETGKSNTAAGHSALEANTSGKFNTVVGAFAGKTNITGSSNVFIGYKAGMSEKGSQKLYIANSARSPLVYGDFNKKTLKVNGKMYATKFITSSDARLKTDIKPLDNALDTILTLQGKQYRLIDEAVDQADIGLIAQDVEKVLPQIVSETEDGYKAIDYQSLTAMLIEGMKEQQDQITALEQENTQLKTVMAKQIEALLARVVMLEGESLAAN